MADGILARLGIVIDTAPLRQGRRETEAELDRIRAAGRNAVNRMQRDFSGLRDTVFGLRGAFASLGVTLAAMKIIAVNREFERLYSQLITVTGGTQKASAAFKELEKFATQTPFELTQSVDAFIQLQARGFDPSIDRLRELGDLSAAFGKDLSDGMLAISAALRSEFEPIRNFGIQIAKDGQQLTITYKGLEQVVTNSATGIQQALSKIVEQNFAGAMERQMDTLGGRFSNLSDAVDAFMREIGQGGLNDAIRDITADLTSLTTSGNDVARTIGQVLGDGLRTAAAAFRWLYENADKVKAAIAAFLAMKFAGIIGGWVVALAALIRALRTLEFAAKRNPLVLIAIGAAAAATQLEGVQKWLDTMMVKVGLASDKFTEFGEKARGLADDMKLGADEGSMASRSNMLSQGVAMLRELDADRAALEKMKADRASAVAGSPLGIMFDKHGVTVAAGERNVVKLWTREAQEGLDAVDAKIKMVMEGMSALTGANTAGIGGDGITFEPLPDSPTKLTDEQKELLAAVALTNRHLAEQQAHLKAAGSTALLAGQSYEDLLTAQQREVELLQSGLAVGSKSYEQLKADLAIRDERTKAIKRQIEAEALAQETTNLTAQVMLLKDYAGNAGAAALAMDELMAAQARAGKLAGMGLTKGDAGYTDAKRQLEDQDAMSEALRGYSMAVGEVAAADIAAALAQRDLNAAMAEGLITPAQAAEAYRKYAIDVLRSQKTMEAGFAAGIETLKMQWADFAAETESLVVDSFHSIGDTLADIVVDGKADFADLFRSIARGIAQLAIQMMILKPLLNLFGGGLGGVTGAATGSVNLGFLNSTPAAFGGAGFAKGGIMGERGPVSLGKYAGGGVTPAFTPHLAMFGEGRNREAFVPLPDGRSIPVTITGGGMGGGGVVINNNTVVNMGAPAGGGQGGGADPAAMERQAAELQRRLDQAFNENMLKATRPGGILNPMGFGPGRGV